MSKLVPGGNEVVFIRGGKIKWHSAATTTDGRTKVKPGKELWSSAADGYSCALVDIDLSEDGRHLVLAAVFRSKENLFTT